MKKNIILALFCLISSCGLAQYNEYEAPTEDKVETNGPRTAIRLNIFGAMAGSYTGEVERVINEKFSVQVAVGYRNININLLYIDPEFTDQVDLFQSGFTVVPQLKYYWTHFSKKLKNPMGSYLAPYVRVGQYGIQLDDNYYNGTYDLTYDLTAVSGGFVFGFQLIAGGHFAMDVFMGPQLKYKKISNVRWTNPSAADDGVVTLSESGYTYEPRVGITLGVAF